MAKQIQPVSSTGEGKDSFTMEFSFDVSENIQEKVEYMAYRSTLGLFKAARDLSDSIPEEYLDAFPVAFEKLRMFYDQGHFRRLQEMVQQIKERRFNQLESEILELMDALADASESPRFTFWFPRDRRSMVAVEKRLSTLGLDDLDDENVILSALLLRLKYLEHEVAEEVPSYGLEVPFGVSQPVLVSRLLEAGYFWAAENILEVCLGHGKDHQHQFSLEIIWIVIAPFLYGPSSTVDEARIWAQIGILQTFCEECLRRGIVDEVKLSNAIQAEQEEKKDSITRLVDLAALAQENEDIRYQSGIRWRLEKLLSTGGPHFTPPDTTVSSVIYDARQTKMKGLTDLEVDSLATIRFRN
ncbi:hypothetical protein KCU65_g6286, partial [Aureobasidium melanogenum]